MKTCKNCKVLFDSITKDNARLVQAEQIDIPYLLSKLAKVKFKGRVYKFGKPE